jgi:pyrroline-5-carboxylate reductase
MNATLNSNISFIGGGNMAQALIGGLLSRGLPTTRIMVSDPVEQIRQLLMKKKFRQWMIM